MSQAPQTDQKPPKKDEADENTDAEKHLSQLHKMSPTAGVTNRDYVAVNHLAIAAMFLGLGSALAMLDIFLLAIPLAGIILAVIAWRQIGDSNGTQTGKKLALAGLLLSLLFGGGEAIREVMKQAAVRDDEAQISEVLAQAGKLIHDSKYDQAYALFDDDFHSYVKPELFRGNLISVQNPLSLGQLQSMDGNGIVKFETAGGTRLAVTKAKMDFAKIPNERYDVTLRQVGGKWLILRFPFFAEPKPSSSKDNFDL